MNPETQPKTSVPVEAASCSIAEPCDTGCCDDHPAAAVAKTGRTGWKAVQFGALCLAGCLAGPLLAGGLAMASGAISGELGVRQRLRCVALLRRGRRGLVRRVIGSFRPGSP